MGKTLGFKWTLIVGAICWLLLYGCYATSKDWRLIVPSQAFHGFAYVFFIIGGQIYTKSVGSTEILSTMQALIFAATSGLGLLVGTRFAGVTMDKAKKGEQFEWRSIFLVPCVILIVCVLVLVLLFKG